MFHSRYLNNSIKKRKIKTINYPINFNLQQSE